jgi:hypothetical protein
MSIAAAAPPPIASENASVWTIRIGGEYRRSCLYLALGGIAILILVLIMPLAPNQAARAQGVFVSLLSIAVPLLAWLYATTWRLRIDEWPGPCRCGGCWCRRPCRGRNATGRPATSAIVTGSEVGPYGVVSS